MGTDDTDFQEILGYYEKKARENRLMFLSLQFIIILIGATIPIINVAEVIIDSQIRIFSSILGGIIIIATSLLQLLKSHENWIIFRDTSNLLRSERNFYSKGASIYSTISEENQRRIKFWERVEDIRSQETNRFFSIHNQRP